MIKIKLTNNKQSFEIGGGSHPVARLESISGLGLLQKEVKSINFVNQSGRIQTSIRDTERTITMAFNFYGSEQEAERLYKLLYSEVDIYITTGTKRRKITGQCLNSSDIESLIYHKWQKIALQFTCNDPYFHDFDMITVPIAKRTDKFPNIQNDDGTWSIQLPAVATERIATTDIKNRGDVVIYPVITLYNQSGISPTTDPSVLIENNTTGASITLEYTMTADETVTIDLPHRRITSSVNGDITKYISDDTVLSAFFLAVGTNNITALNNGSGTAMTMTMQYSNSYGAVVI